jgi:hypothetical protein
MAVICSLAWRSYDQFAQHYRLWAIFPFQLILKWHCAFLAVHQKLIKGRVSGRIGVYSSSPLIFRLLCRDFMIQFVNTEMPWMICLGSDRMSFLFNTGQYSAVSFLLSFLVGHLTFLIISRESRHYSWNREASTEFWKACPGWENKISLRNQRWFVLIHLGCWPVFVWFRHGLSEDYASVAIEFTSKVSENLNMQNPTSILSNRMTWFSDSMKC